MFSERVITRLEHLTIVDRPADAGVKMLNFLLRPGRIKDALSGTWLGHPAHPALVALPIGSWVGASWLDIRGTTADHEAAQNLVSFGLLAAVPTALMGAADWSDTAGAERRVGFIHAITNCAAVGLYASSWQARRHQRHRAGAILALAGGGLIGLGGWLGGHLTYAAGVGVDTTAFLAGPSEWTVVAAETDLRDDEPIKVDVGPVPVFLMRQGNKLFAMNDRCTHRGAPLHEGSVTNGCIECPWHGSRFKLTDGEVSRGPATRPQPTFDVRVDQGQVLIRQCGEQRSLRLNPVGSGNA